MTSDPRETRVQNFRVTQNARQVFILTAVTPFSVSQERFVVMASGDGVRLITCAGCTPRTDLAQGQARPVALDVWRNFQVDLSQTEMAWAGDAVPPNVHDGLTITVERAEPESYERVRIVAAPPQSPHARLLEAWARAFPEVRRALG